MNQPFSNEIAKEVLDACCGMANEIRDYWSSIFYAMAQTSGQRRQAGRTLDCNVERIILQHLNTLPWGWSGVSEEAGETKSQLRGVEARVAFLIDAVDATHNAELGIPFFSTSIACYHEGRRVLGWVYDPSRDVAYIGVSGEGAYVLQHGREWRNARCNHVLRVRDAVIGTFRPQTRTDYSRCERLFLGAKKIRILSCSSIELSLIATGAYDAFVDIIGVGHERECDIAAAALVLQEAGGELVNEQGEPFRFCSPSLRSITERMKVLGTCTSELSSEIRKTLSIGRTNDLGN